MKERIIKEKDFIIIVSKDNGKWHLSISHKNRYPTWREIKKARYKYLKDVPYMAMILPPEEEYVNVHPNCFHLWQIYDEDIK